MSANEKCPHCGAKIVPSRDADPRETEWRCGTERYVKFLGGFNRSELCRERELRQKAEAQNKELHELLERALVVEALTLSGTWEQRAIRDQYDLLKHFSGGAQ